MLLAPVKNSFFYWLSATYCWYYLFLCFLSVLLQLSFFEAHLRVNRKFIFINKSDNFLFFENRVEKKKSLHIRLPFSSFNFCNVSRKELLLTHIGLCANHYYYYYLSSLIVLTPNISSVSDSQTSPVTFGWSRLFPGGNPAKDFKLAGILCKTSLCPQTTENMPCFFFFNIYIYVTHHSLLP